MKISDIIAIEKLEYDKKTQRDNRIKKVNSYPSYIEGVFSHKGNVIPIVDFEKLNSGHSTFAHNENKLIFLKGLHTNFGLLVNDVSTIVEFDESLFTKILDEYPVYTVEKDGEIYSIPDIKELVNIKKLAMVFNDIKNAKDI